MLLQFLSSNRNTVLLFCRIRKFNFFFNFKFHHPPKIESSYHQLAPVPWTHFLAQLQTVLLPVTRCGVVVSIGVVCCCCHCQCWHCGQKLMSKLSAWISKDQTSKFLFFIYLFTYFFISFLLGFLGIFKRFLNQSVLNFQNKACFSKPVKMSPRSAML